MPSWSATSPFLSLLKQIGSRVELIHLYELRSQLQNHKLTVMTVILSEFVVL
jgi:hypothetical protein